MSTAIDFYYDFSSPYGYLASMKIEQLAAEIGRTINWYPILMGPMFKLTGSAPPANVPLKGKYSLHDFARSALLFDLPYKHPQEFPIATVSAARAAIYLRHQGNDLIASFTKKAYTAYFADNQDIREISIINNIVQDLGLNPQDMQTAIADQAIKDELKNDVSHAIERGVFGSPFIFVDDEPFWGFDRFEHIKLWVKKLKSNN